MRKTMTSLAALYLVACLTLPAGALSYTIDAPGNPDYGTATSVEPDYIGRRRYGKQGCE